MKKNEVVTMILGTLSVLLLASGTCMILINEWNLMTQGIVFSAIGLILGIAALINSVAHNSKNGKSLSKRTFLIVLFSVLGALTLGGGMSLVMVYGIIFWGIVLGCIGIFLLMMLIPVINGIEK